MVVVVAKVVFAPDLSSTGIAVTVGEIEVLIIEAVPSMRFVYLEPDLEESDSETS